nr:hypothetical protein [Silvibacterium dinghuense]
MQPFTQVADGDEPLLAMAKDFDRRGRFKIELRCLFKAKSALAEIPLMLP